MSDGHGEHSLVTVTIDGQCVAQATDVATLANQVAAQNASWNVLAGGEQIGLTPDPGALAGAALFVPDQQTVDQLNGNVGVYEVADVGVSINGTCWGWAFDRTAGAWLLLPCEFAELARDLFRFSASQEQSMTGMVVEVACRTLGGVTVASQWDEFAGTRWFEVAYRNADEPLIARSMSMAFDWETVDSFCLSCVEEQGWLLDMHVDPMIGGELVTRAMNLYWRPCENHLAAASERVDLIGVSFRWSHDGWKIAQ